MSIRVQLVFYPQESENTVMNIPLDFRRHFISITKQLLCQSSAFHRYSLEKPGYAPFAIGVEFAAIGEVSLEKSIMEIRPPAIMTFSTGDIGLFTQMCNEAIQKRKLHILGMELRTVQLQPPIQITSAKAELSLLGHMVLRTETGYIKDSNDRTAIEEAINYHMQTKADYLRTYWDIPVPKLEPLSITNTSQLRLGVCFHYSGLISSLRGSFECEGNPDTIQFLYDYGVGSRNGQAFGLVKEVRGI